MSNTLNGNKLEKRTLLAVTLSISLAAFGCTSDRNLGNGDPVMTPGMHSSPTSGMSSGSESAPSIPPPMISSSTYSAQSAAALPRVQTRTQSSDVRRLSPDQAAAIMAGHQPGMRVLGPAMPGNSGRGYVSDGLVTGQFVNPAMLTNPTVTINSSATSEPVPAISSGAGEAVGGTLIGTDAAGLLTDAATIGTTATTATGGVGGAVIGTTATGTAATPTGAAAALPVGTSRPARSARRRHLQ